MFLVVIAVLSVPVLLLGKPVYLYWLHHGNSHLRMYRVRAFGVHCGNCAQIQLEYSFFEDKHAILNGRSLYSQGYERVRRNSDEEVYLMRAHDMEEGSSHSDLSSSGEHQTEEVRASKFKPSVFLINNHFSCLYCDAEFYFVVIAV